MRTLNMKLQQIVSQVLFITILCSSCNDEIKQKVEFDLDDMMIRIAALEIDPNYFEDYIAILKEEAAESVRLEPGVLCIFPMCEKENPTQIRLLEIYANKEAYESHLKTPHFLHYKTTTLPMVKSLRLVDMEAVDKKVMSKIFEKIKN